MRCKPMGFFSFLLTIASLAPLAAAANQQVDSFYGPLPVFEFHSSFWVNLHHTLYFEAKQRSTSPSAREDAGAAAKSNLKITSEASAPLSPAEQRAWNEAVSYYAANFANRDLLFNNDLILIKNQLGDFEDCDELSGAKKKSCDAGLAAKLAQLLESAAPIFRAHFWPAHDRANRAWIARVAPLVREQGLGLSERLADIYQTKWPRAKIRVDASVHANWAGAYTTLDPLRVTISSIDSRNQGAAALEVLFHEASHGIAEPVQSAILRECRQRGKAIPRDLWHALIFYTTGEVIKPIMTETSAAQPSEAEQHNTAPIGSTSPGPSASHDLHDKGYTPYAIREGLYQRGWNAYLQLLTRFWQPYLDGHATFDDAIARMVSAL